MKNNHKYQNFELKYVIKGEQWDQIMSLFPDDEFSNFRLIEKEQQAAFIISHAFNLGFFKEQIENTIKENNLIYVPDFIRNIDILIVDYRKQIQCRYMIFGLTDFDATQNPELYWNKVKIDQINQQEVQNQIDVFKKYFISKEASTNPDRIVTADDDVEYEMFYIDKKTREESIYFPRSKMKLFASERKSDFLIGMRANEPKIIDQNFKVRTPHGDELVLNVFATVTKIIDNKLLPLTESNIKRANSKKTIKDIVQEQTNEYCLDLYSNIVRQTLEQLIDTFGTINEVKNVLPTFALFDTTLFGTELEVDDLNVIVDQNFIEEHDSKSSKMYYSIFLRQHKRMLFYRFQNALFENQKVNLKLAIEDKMLEMAFKNKSLFLIDEAIEFHSEQEAIQFEKDLLLFISRVIFNIKKYRADIYSFLTFLEKKIN
ncbi:hypothetical protein ACJA25_00635 [Mycoplasmopsis hyopharyngis]|uniref:hypothetical protein n=1 Tax=Mycoplasmopsis hyopharyngis TaxID=29558 RepID=UPI003872D21A